jgi:hypothetical protein
MAGAGMKGVVAVAEFENVLSEPEKKLSPLPPNPIVNEWFPKTRL